MVNIFKVCARSGASDLVWMCWNGNNKSNCKVGYGSNLLALTAKGARIMMMDFTEWFETGSLGPLCEVRLAGTWYLPRRALRRLPLSSNGTL